MKATTKGIQWATIIVLAGLLCLPAVEMLTGLFGPQKLGGVEVALQRPPLRVRDLVRGTYQKAFGKWFAQNLGLRPWLVRLDNQLHYSIFGELPAASKVVVGKNDYLYAAGTIDYYNGKTSVPDETLAKFAEQLRTLQARLRKRGVGFLFLISPAKTTILPEFIPPGRVVSVRPESTYRRLRPMLKGVNYLDAVEYYRAWKEQGHAFPLFAKTGTHWSYQSACVFSNHLAEKMEGIHGRRLARSDCSKRMGFPSQILSDRDLLDLMNLIHEKPFLKRTVYPRIGVEQGPGGKVHRPNVLYVGDSFLWQILYYMDAVPVHERRNVYYYFRRDYRFPGNADAPIHRRALDWKQQVFARDLIVLEINEVHLGSLGFGFVQAALQQLR